VVVRRVIVNGEAQDADRHDALVPRSPTPSKGITADPFYRQILAAHCLNEIADSKILNLCLATRSQDARAFEEAVTATMTATVTATSTGFGFRARRQAGIANSHVPTHVEEANADCLMSCVITPSRW